MMDDPASTGCQQFVEGTREISPANLLMKIESFSLLSKYGIDKYESKAFEAGGYKWKVIVCFDGDDDEDEGHVSAYLASAETESLPQGWEVNAVFIFFIYNHLSDIYLSFRGTTRRFNAVISKSGFSKMISNKTLMDPSKGYVVDDNCVFGAEVFVFTKPISECLSFIKDAPLFKRDWKIPDFSKFWASEEFEVGDHKWKVLLDPKGIGSEAKDHCISIFVYCVDAKGFGPHHKVKAQITLSIKNNLSDTYLSKKIGAMRSQGFLVDDCCFLDVEMSVQSLILDAPKL